MTPPQARPVSTERPLAGTAIAAATGAAEGPFVINLRSSTTPMALSQPNDPALARFKFFMSRRLEDGRERFRLHMGFFETLAEAEEWLGAVREIYPGAWAGDAPGKRLKARAPEPATPSAASASAVAAPPPVAQARPAPAPRPAVAQAAHREAAMPAASEQSRRPTRAPAPHAAPVIPSNVPVLRPASSVAPRQTAVRQPRPTAAEPRPANVGRPATPPAKVASTSKQKAAAPRLPLSNVREVLAALDETGATRQMPALATGTPTSAPAQASAPAPAPRVAERVESEQNLSDTQVLKLLENRRADGGAAEVDRGISLLKPDDTATRRALKEALATNAPVSFAVQLQWSVQSIDISKVPPLAIFSAYTLYTVEGSREGRRWYGLRLGFFSDAISAKQVAHYVRSEFNSVAVVPVSPQERGRASDATKDPVQGPKTATSPLRDRLPEPTVEFKLLDDQPALPTAPSVASRQAAAAASASAAKPAPAEPAERSSGSQSPAQPKAATAAKRGSRTPAGRVRARDRRSPQTLEETLEILGADQLEIDQGRGETLNDTGVRHIRVEVKKNSPFSRLLDRLSERARGR
jgi:hypothetical protein